MTNEENDIVNDGTKMVLVINGAKNPDPIVDDGTDMQAIIKGLKPAEDK